MEKEQVVGRYHGVNIIKSCGYFYPSVNGDIECKSINAVKRWIKDVWVFVENNLAELDTENGLTKGSSMKFMNNFLIK